VGVSIDGPPEVHDRFRNQQGAFDAAIAGLRCAAAAGLRTGVRFTLTRANFEYLDTVLGIVEREHIDRFCMYHLVYAGRGHEMVRQDVNHAQSRSAVERLVETARDWAARDVGAEILTADNHADGIVLLDHIERTEPARLNEVRELLELSGGCSAGRKIAAVGPSGEVYPCQFWTHESMGNVREKPLSAIWSSEDCVTLNDLRRSEGYGEGRCGKCGYHSLCRGCRIRAMVAGGGLWADDPQCYLSDDEIAI